MIISQPIKISRERKIRMKRNLFFIFIRAFIGKSNQVHHPKSAKGTIIWRTRKIMACPILEALIRWGMQPNRMVCEKIKTIQSIRVQIFTLVFCWSSPTCILTCIAWTPIKHMQIRIAENHKIIQIAAIPCPILSNSNAASNSTQKGLALSHNSSDLNRFTANITASPRGRIVATASAKYPGSCKSKLKK